MNDDLKEAFIVAALETFKKLSECPELKSCQIYREPGKTLNKKLQKRTALERKSTSATKTASSLPFRWVLVVSAQKSARESVLKVRGYRQA